MNASLHALSHSTAPSPGAPPNLRLRVGEHVVDLGALRVVTNPGAPRLSSKAAGVLVELARRPGGTVLRDELLNRVWRDRITTPDVLTQAIKELRRAFVDDTRPSRYIETVPKVGYRLLAPVTEIDPDVLPARDVAPLPPANDAAPPPLARAVRPSAVRPSRVRRAGAVAGVALAIVAIALVAWRYAAAPAARGWAARDSRALTSDPGPERRPRISPDGTRFAYSRLDPDSGFERIVVRGVEQSESMQPTLHARGHEELPAWSPDGTRIAFERLDRDERCTLFIVPSMGGAEDQVGPCGDFRVSYFDWTPDGRGLILSDQQASDGGLPLVVLDLASGERRALRYRRATSDQDIDPHYSPDGRWIAFRRGLSPHSDLFVMAADGSDLRRLTQLDARIAGHAWTPDGATLVFAGNADGALALYAVDVRDGAIQPLHVAPAAFPTMARSGNRVLYEIQRTKTLLAAAALSPDAPAAARPDGLHYLARSTGSDSAPAVSPDGRRVAFVSDRNGAQELWLHELDEASEPRVLTDYTAAVIAHPAWSSDGTRLLASVHEQGRTRLVEIDVASRRQHAVAVSQHALLGGDYGPRPGSYLVLRRGRDARSELVELDEADTARERIVPLADAVEHAELDRAAGLVYYTRSDVPGLFRRPLGGGTEQAVTRKVTANILDGWRIVDGHVWYVSGMMQKPFDLRELDPDTGTERVRLHVDAWLRDVNFDVTPDRERVLLAPIGPEDIDVGALTLAPA